MEFKAVSRFLWVSQRGNPNMPDQRAGAGAARRISLYPALRHPYCPTSLILKTSVGTALDAEIAEAQRTQSKLDDSPNG